MVGLPQFDLKRHQARPASVCRTGKRKHLAALDHFAHSEVQQPVKVGVAVAVAVARPILPQRVDALVQRRVAGSGARPDPGADNVVDQNLHSLGSHGVVPDQIAHAVTQNRPSACDFLVGGVASGPPAVRPAPFGCGFVSAFTLDRVTGVEPSQRRFRRKHCDGSVDQAITQGRRNALGHQDLRKLANPAIGSFFPVCDARSASIVAMICLISFRDRYFVVFPS